MSVFVWLVAFYAVVASAAQVRLQWDANDPVPDGYRLYQRIEGQAYNSQSPAVWSGSTTTCTVEGLESGKNYFFTVRAYSGNNESADSNEVSYSTLAEGSDSDNGGALPYYPPANNSDQGGGDFGSPDTDENGGGSSANSAPAKPSLNDPCDRAENIILTPILKTNVFTDVDGDNHARTSYEISTTSDFSSLVFQRTFTQHLTALRIPALILDPETTYFWRVRFFDSRNCASEWSEHFQFTTIDYAAAGDLNGNGMLDEQEIEFSWKGDGIADVLHSGLVGVSTSDGYNPAVAVIRISDHIQVVGIVALDAEDLPAANRPANLTGVFSFKLLLANDISTATVKVLLSEPAPYDAKWFEFDPEDGWTVSQNAVFSQDRKTLTLVLEDGGSDDPDGVCNGIIVNSSGLRYSSQAFDTSSYSLGSGAGSACFIGTSAGMPVNVTTVAILLLAAVGMIYTLTARLERKCAQLVQWFVAEVRICLNGDSVQLFFQGKAAVLQLVRITCRGHKNRSAVYENTRCERAGDKKAIPTIEYFAPFSAVGHRHNGITRLLS